MDSTSYPVPHPQVAARIVDGSAVIVLADSGQVNVLNSVGTRIWELADGTRTVGQIADIIQREFEVTGAQALDDAAAFLQELVELNAQCLKLTA